MRLVDARRPMRVWECRIANGTAETAAWLRFTVHEASKERLSRPDETDYPLCKPTNCDTVSEGIGVCDAYGGES